MSRLGCFVLAFALAPAAALAQEPTEADATRVHTVRAGDTLGEIAHQYYGTASEWPRILDANRDRLTDPDQLRVGLELTLPGSTPPVRVAVTAVSSVQSAVSRPPTQDGSMLEARRTMLQAAPLEPMGTPVVPITNRTVFFEVPQLRPRAAIVVLEGAQRVPAFPLSVFHAAGWLVPARDRTDQVGEVLGWADARAVDPRETTAQLYEDLRVRSFSEVSVGVGEEFLVYDVTREIEGVGEVAAPTGRVVVLTVEGDRAVVEVVQQFARMNAGQRLARARTFPLAAGERPEALAQGIEVRIRAMQEIKELYLPGDFGFVDAGPDGGLALGDELVGLSDGEGNWTERGIARFQVVGLRDDGATVRVLTALVPSAIRPGLRLRVDRKMP